MYEGLRLTELHEEWGWNSERAKRDRRDNLPHQEIVHQLKANQADAEIRARVAAQKIIEDRLPKAMIPPGLIEPLRFGVPDARRNYRQRYFSDWTNHELHAAPVEGCHLCQMVRIGLAGGGPF